MFALTVATMITQYESASNNCNLQFETASIHTSRQQQEQVSRTIGRELPQNVLTLQLTLFELPAL